MVYWMVYRPLNNVMKLRSLWLMDSNLSADFIELFLQFVAVETWLVRDSSAFCVRFDCAWDSAEGHCGVWGWIGAGLATEGSWRFQVRYFNTFSPLVTTEAYFAREFGTHLHLFRFLSPLIDGHYNHLYWARLLCAVWDFAVNSGLLVLISVCGSN